MNNENFYTDLTAFKDFSDVASMKHYQLAPPNWHVVLTDIKNSTKLIQDGWDPLESTCRHASLSIL